jgi:hypothetical protein
MKSAPIKEVFNELFSHLERLETQSEAILQFLKEKKRVTDKQLAPYLEQAGNAANVRWRAARIRIEHLLADAEEAKETKLGKKPEIAAAETAKPETAKPETAKTEAATGETANNAQAAPAENGQPENQKQEVQKKEAQTKEQADKKVQPETSAELADKKPPSADNKQVAPQAQQPSPKDGKPEQPKEFSHPTEMTESLAQSKGAEPPAELAVEKKSGDKEAA